LLPHTAFTFTQIFDTLSLRSPGVQTSGVGTQLHWTLPYKVRCNAYSIANRQSLAHHGGTVPSLAQSFICCSSTSSPLPRSYIHGGSLWERNWYADQSPFLTIHSLTHNPFARLFSTVSRPTRTLGPFSRRAGPTPPDLQHSISLDGPLPRRISHMDNFFLVDRYANALRSHSHSLLQQCA
jgi:hypothetical protein